MNKAKQSLFTMAVILVAVLVALALAEATLRIAMKPAKTYSMLLPGKRVFQPDARYVHGIAGPAHYDVNPEGYRGRRFGADAAEYRILLVGGSTTECTLLDVSEHWSTVLENNLKQTSDGRSTWVGNVGRSGLTARDHAVTVKYLLKQYPRIDMVIVLAGVNDLTAALRQGDAYQAPPPVTGAEAERKQIRNAFVISPEGFHKPLVDGAATETAWYKSTRIYDLARRARMGGRARTTINAIGGSSLDQWRRHRQSGSRTIDALPNLDAPLHEYRTNLNAIVDAAAQTGTQVVFMTQPSLWKHDITPAEEKLLWLGGTGPFQDVPGQAYFSVSALTEAMARYNQTMLDVCREKALPCLDLAAAVPRDTTLMYDDVHFTEAGAAVVGELVAKHIRTVRPELFGVNLAISR